MNLYIIEYFKRIRYIFESILFTHKLIDVEIHFGKFLKRCGFKYNVLTNLSSYATLNDYIEHVESMYLHNSEHMYNLLTYGCDRGRWIFLNKPSDKLIFVLLENIKKFTFYDNIENDLRKTITIYMNGKTQFIFDYDLDDIAVILSIYIKDDLDIVKIHYIGQQTSNSFYECVKTFVMHNGYLILRDNNVINRGFESLIDVELNCSQIDINDEGDVRYIKQN